MRETRSGPVAGWSCPVCRACDGSPWLRVSAGTEAGVDAAAFVPSADRFGGALGTVVRCRACGHGAVSVMPASEGVSRAYADAADPVSVREERGQVETARRALEAIEGLVA